MHTGYELVWIAAERTPDHPALVDDRTARVLTYRELMAEIDAVAAGFAERGIGRGTRVATALPNLWEHCIAILALMRLNAVPALMNFRLKPEEIAQLCKACDIRAAVLLPDPDVVGAVAAALPDGAPVWTAGWAVAGSVDFAGCRADAAALPPYEQPGTEETAFLFFTSGTTGLPKAVVLAHKTTEHRLVWLSTHGGLRCGTHNRSLGCMPLGHAIGFYGVFLVTLAFNGTFFVVSEFNPVALVDLVERERISYAFCVPTMFGAMTAAPNYAPEKFASMELALYGGISIEPALLERIDREWGGVIRHIYGTTETMCALHNPEPVGRHATLRPGYYSRTRLARIGGAGPDDVVEAGEEGELIVDSTVDTMFTEYLGRADATAEKLRDGWYYTGDVFLQEADGDVTLVGRVDDMIRSGGESIHPEEVESVIDDHAAVVESSVIGIPDEKWGQMVVACVILGDGAPSADVAAALDAHCRASTLAGFKRPKAYMFVETFPRNAANKVLRRHLRDDAAKAAMEKLEDSPFFGLV
jgi:2-furoate---CoA ligase